MFVSSSAFALALATLLVLVSSFVFCFVIFTLLRPYKKQLNRTEVTQIAYYRILKGPHLIKLYKNSTNTTDILIVHNIINAINSVSSVTKKERRRKTVEPQDLTSKFPLQFALYFLVN